MGFDSSTIEIEKETRPADDAGERRERKPRPAPRAGSAPKAQERGDSAQARRPSRDNHKGKPASATAPAVSRDRAATPSTRVQQAANRSPEEFLDDEVDNFGNRVDYVSPYQNQKGQARRNGSGRPAAAAKPASTASTAARSPDKAKSPTPSAPGKPSANANKPRQQAPRRPARPYGGQERQLTPFEKSPSAEPAPRARQPVIVRKESKLERLPSLEQLEQLERQERQAPSRTQGEKPALLKRNP